MDIYTTDSQLLEVVSTSHPTASIQISTDKHSCHIELSSTEIPDKDFVLIYRDDKMY